MYMEPETGFQPSDILEQGAISIFFSGFGTAAQYLLGKGGERKEQWVPSQWVPDEPKPNLFQNRAPVASPHQNQVLAPDT